MLFLHTRKPTGIIRGLALSVLELAMQSWTRRTLTTLVALGAFVGAGCGGDIKLVEVKGTVTFKGKPLSDAQVEFMPDPDQGTIGPRSTATTDAQGNFKLVCDDQRNGAVPGKHRVTITDLKQWEGIRPGREDANKPLKPSRIPARYADAAQTPFKNIEVKAGVGPIKLEVTSP
jgi:hypothetical protein